MLQMTRSSPTHFVFALRAQDKQKIFERQEDYIRLLCAEDQSSLKEWVLSIRCAIVSRQEREDSGESMGCDAHEPWDWVIFRARCITSNFHTVY